VLSFAGCLNILSMHGSCLAMLDMLLQWLVLLSAVVAGWLSVWRWWLALLSELVAMLSG
jgi:hypothetical protein